MRNRGKTSQYFLTKDRKLEIQEAGETFRAAVPLRFSLNPISWVKNALLTFIRHKRKMRGYDILDLKDQKVKKLYLTHHEILQVWNHPTSKKQSKPKVKKLKK